MDQDNLGSPLRYSAFTCPVILYSTDKREPLKFVLLPYFTYMIPSSPVQFVLAANCMIPFFLFNDTLFYYPLIMSLFTSLSTHLSLDL